MRFYYCVSLDSWAGLQGERDSGVNIGRTIEFNSFLVNVTFILLIY